MKVKACPLCGRLVEGHCWHSVWADEGHEVELVEMDVAEALKLAERHLSSVQDELDNASMNVQKLSKMKSEEVVK